MCPYCEKKLLELLEELDIWINNKLINEMMKEEEETKAID